MNRYWSALARELHPYVPGEQPRLANLIKLNTNESPYSPSPQALAAIREAANGSLRLYPDPNATALREALAAYHGVAAANVFVGNGSDEVLAHTFAALLNQEQPLLFPDVTYSFYPVYAQLTGVRWQPVPLDETMRVRVSDYRRPCGAIILANPNAPTGLGLPLAEIAALLAQNRHAPVVVDEAYVDFGGETALPLIAENPNLLVVRTFSKSRALAGLRVGYAIGDAGLVEALTRVKDSFNSYPLGAPAQAGAIAALADEGYFKARVDDITRERATMNLGLNRLGFDVLDSSANFLFARHKSIDGASLALELRRKSILVRHFAKPRIHEFLRITVGLPEDTERLLSALGDILSIKSQRR